MRSVARVSVVVFGMSFCNVKRALSQRLLFKVEVCVGFEMFVGCKEIVQG